MSARFVVPVLLTALFAAEVSAQPGRFGTPPAPLFLPPPPSTVPTPPAVRPLGYHVAPYGGLGYGPLGDRTGYPGGIYSNYNGSYRSPPALPLILETPRGVPLRSGNLPSIAELFPGAPPEPPLRMPLPIPPGPVVPVGEGK